MSKRSRRLKRAGARLTARQRRHRKREAGVTVRFADGSAFRFKGYLSRFEFESIPLDSRPTWVTPINIQTEAE